MAALIHPTAKIHPTALIGDKVEIGPNTEVRPYAIITGSTRIGANNQIGYGAVIGAEPQDFAFDPVTVSYVQIGNNNIIREQVTIHRGTKPESVTSVGDNCFLMANAHLGHNCKVENGAILANNALCAGYVEIGEKAFISGNTVIHQFCRVGRLALLRGGGRISKDIPPFMIGDATNRLMGLNTIGLRRAGFSAALRLEIKRLFNHLFFSGLNLSQALASDSACQNLPEIDEILSFIRAAKRGIVMPRHLQMPDEEE